VKNNLKAKEGDVAQVVNHFTSKCKILSSNFGTDKKESELTEML
jgi:hypothetical protein